MRPDVGRPSRRKKKVVYVEADSDEDERERKQTGGNPGDISELPPEFRTAGLIAQMEIPKGKVFGPFAGVISDQEEPPSSVHTFVCQVKDSKTQRFKCFYAKSEERHKCDWLKMIKHPFGKNTNNFIAFNNVEGVCYEATKDITIGEELLVLFEKDRRGALKKWTITTRRKRPSVIKSTSAHDGNEAADTKASVAALTPKRERSRKNAPRRIIKEPEISESASDENAHKSLEIAPQEAFEITEDTAPTQASDEPLSAKGEKRIKFSPLEDQLDLSNDSQKHDSDEDHERTGIVENDDTMKCSHCNKNFESAETFEKHFSSGACGTKSFKCQDCSVVLRKKKYLEKHKLSFHTKHECQECKLTFSKLMDLRKHDRETHPEAKKLFTTCQICYRKVSKCYLIEHVRAHNNVFKCEVCDKIFSNHSNLRKHLRRHKPGYTPKKQTISLKKVKCDTCGKMLIGNQALRAHMRLHTGERPYSCDKCEWTFVQGSHLRRHKRNQHGEGDKAGKHQCNTCQRWYSSESVLEMHIDTIHKGLRPFKCNICKDTFNIQGLLLRHQRELHQMTVDLPEEERKYICKQEDCGKKFSLQSDLNKHIFEHTGVHPYQCKECDSHFSSSGNLGKHVRRIHRGMKISDNKPANANDKWECTLCERKFSNAASLREHARIHTGERIKCSKCSATFVQRSGLRKHLRCLRCPGLKQEMEEKGENPQPKVYKRSRTWKCDKCEKCFTGPSDLKAHDRVHTGERPFPCEACGKSFTQPGNLTKHEKYVHGGEKRPKESRRDKRFSCSMCCKSFTSPADLSMHCRSHTGVKPFECVHCGMAFTQKGNLKKHILRWHTPNTPKARRRLASSGGQEERVVIKGFSASSPSTPSGESTTCSVVLPPSFITNNKEIVITNVPISMAAMLKQKATEVANTSQPSSESVTSLIQCLTASQKATSSSPLVGSSPEIDSKLIKQPATSPEVKTPAASFSDTPVSSFANMNTLSKTPFSSQLMPAVSSFMKLTEPQPVSCSSVYPLDLVKSFLPGKPPTSVDGKQNAALYTEPQPPPGGNLSAKDLHRVQDLLGDSSLLDIGNQKSSTGNNVPAPTLNFAGDFTGQVRGMEFAQTDLGNSRFRLPVRSTLGRLQPDSPKGLHLPFDNQQLAAGNFLSSQRLTHPDIPRQSRVARREAFPNVLDTHGEFTVANNHPSLHHNFTNASLSQPLPGVGNYFHSPGKMLNTPWDQAAVIRDNGMHANDNQMNALLVQQSFKLIGSNQADTRK